MSDLKAEPLKTEPKTDVTKSDISIKKAVIMAGGFGTRLRPLTMNIPKPLVPMMQKPMMHHIVNLLKQYGIKEITSMLFYQPDAIRDYFGDGKKVGVKMHYIQSDADYGTAGSVRNAADLIDERFIVISGDVLTDFNLAKAMEFHQKRGAKATMILTRVKNPVQFGVVITEPDGKVSRFLEKPTWGEVFSDTINTGIYILEREVLDLIPFHEDYDFSKDLFPRMLRENMGLYGYIAEGYWRDIGTLPEYQEAHLDCLHGRVGLDFGEGYEKIAAGIFVHKTAKYDPDTVKFSGSVYVGKGSKIGKGVTLHNSVVGDSVTIGDGSHLNKVVAWSEVQFGKNVDAHLSVICNHVKIGNDVKIEEQTFIAERCKIGNHAVIRPNIKIWPEKEIEDGAILTQSLVWESKWSRELFTGARITGIANIEINPEFAAKLGASFGTIIGEGGTVAVSRDVDKVSRMISRALIAGLLSSGITVNDLQATPIPITRHRLKNSTELGGVHTRKSPYDKNLCDIIFFDKDGRDLPTGKTQKIERHFFGEDYKRSSYENVGNLNFPERAIESYTDSFLNSVESDVIRKARLRVAIDYSHGAASTIFPSIIGGLGIDLISMNAFLDPKKFTRTADEFLQAADKLSEIVVSLGYDIGFMLDGGAERVYIADERGNFLDHQRLLTLITRLFIDVNPETRKIAVPITASQEIDDICSERGIAVVRTGDSHLDLMRTIASDPEISFVGGTKGGFVFPKFLFAVDGMFSCVKIMEMMAKSKVRIGDLSVRYPEKYFMIKRNISCPKDAKGKVMRKIMEDTASNYRILIDGVKIIFDNETSLLLLPDKERDIFHINAESRSKSRAVRLVSEYERKLSGWVLE
ncbi:MAG: sugar phosphate nucleotidyltransferase [Chloroherpetonaceae bacterium]|nr:sugar phosphate nucleotidyltransferase [Chloroherpetonaceae bacterium]